MAGEHILRIISGLLIGVWVARYLGPEQFGAFSYALAVSTIFGGMAKLGLDNILVRELISQPQLYSSYLGTAFWLKLIAAFLILAFILVIITLTKNDASINLYILIISSGLIFQSIDVIEFYFISQILGKTISICKAIQLALSSIIKIYLIFIQAELVFFVLISLFDAIILAMGYSLAYWLHGHQIFYRNFNMNIAKKLLADSWPLIFSALVITIYMRIDQIMIKEILGEHQAGIYSAAVRISESFYFIAVLLTASLFPAIINAKKTNELLYISRLQKLYTFMVWLSILIALPMVLLSDWLIILLYGNAYEQASSVLIIHAWSITFVFLGVASSKWLIAENMQMLSFLRTFYGMIINIILNFFLIKKYGIIGAAIATLIAQATAAYFFDFFNKKTRINFILKSKAFLLLR